jgi:hypothetical protein
MLTARGVLFGIALPALWSAAVLIAAWFASRGRPKHRASLWAGPVSLAGGFAGASIGISGRIPPIPPVQITDWLLLVVLALAIFSPFAAFVGAVHPLRVSVGFAVLAIVVWLLIRPLPAATLGSTAKIVFATSLAAIATAWWIALSTIEREPTAIAVLLSWLVVSATASVVLVLSGSLLFGQLAGSLVAALGPCVVYAWFSDGLSLTRGGALVFLGIVVGLLLGGYFYAYLTRMNGALLLLAAILSCAVRFSPISALGGWKQSLSQVVLVSIPSLTSLVIAAADFMIGEKYG